ncbi:Hypothetical protein A7982_10156 [Minicystis rosea]|nr:Hypothetical protein A7982_10156 [Minicystis rosea]
MGVSHESILPVAARGRRAHAAALFATVSREACERHAKDGGRRARVWRRAIEVRAGCRRITRAWALLCGAMQEPRRAIAREGLASLPAPP